MTRSNGCDPSTPTCSVPKAKRRLQNFVWSCPRCKRLWALRYKIGYDFGYLEWEVLDG